MENSTNDKLNKAVVYIADIPSNREIGKAYPAERDLEISVCYSATLAKQRYFVWELLSYALEQTIGKSVKEANLYKDENGVWRCKEIFFSLSHSKNALAVAVSDYPVGVDIELLDGRFNDKLASRILTETELKQYEQFYDITDLFEDKPFEKTQAFKKAAFLCQCWTQKESIFKQTQCETPVSQIEKSKFNAYTAGVRIQGKPYAYSVAYEKGLEVDVRFKFSN